MVNYQNKAENTAIHTGIKSMKNTTQQQTQINGDFNTFKKYEGSSQAIKDVKDKLGLSCQSVKQITKGANNGLFIITTTTGSKIVIKFYQHDDRNRLTREYTANSFLSKHGFNVAKPLLKNTENNYGIYSFKEGKSINATEASQKDTEQLADFLVHLQQFKQSDIPENFPTSVVAMFNTKDIINDNESRLSALQQALKNKTAHPLLLEQINIDKYTNIVHKLTKYILKHSQNTSWNIGKDEARLSPVDFGFHNALFRGDKPPVILDLEYFGWDDPLHVVADFIAHDQTLGLPQHLKERFLNRYTKGANLSASEQTRLTELIALTDIKWIAIYLTTLTPKYIKARAFASNNDFNEENYINNQIKKIEKRIASVTTRDTRNPTI